MPKHSSKHATLDQRMVVPTQGMNLAAPPNAIGDNELSRAYNWWYEPERGLCVRQGLAREDVAALSNPIVALHPYVDAGGTLRLLAASGGKLYERDGSTWDEVVATVSTSSHVSAITFNGAALIADGVATNGLLKYDGSTTSYVTDSPEAPLCVTSHANRVVCASASTPDYVYFSGPNDFTDWATASPGAALTIAAGFGDGYSITGLATIYDALVVSKVKRDTDGNIVGRKLYAIFTGGAPDSWQVKLISSENAAMLPGGLVTVGEVIYLLDTNGFKAISPTPNGGYGDISVDPAVGVKVNKLVTQLTRSADALLMAYIPSLAQIWCVVGSDTQARAIVMHPIQGAFTQIDFGTFIPRCCAEVGQVVYVAGSNGSLYRLSNVGTDELTEDTYTDVYATLRTRTFEGLGGDLILKKSKLIIEPIRPAHVSIEAYILSDNERKQIGTIETGSGSAAMPLYEAYDKVIDAQYTLGDSTTNYDSTFYGGPRAASMALQVRTSGGRIVLNSLTAEFAVVGR